MYKNRALTTKTCLSALTLATLFATTVSQASDEHLSNISYDFFDVAYMDVETHSDDGDGFLLRASKSLGESFYLLAEMGDAELDEHHGDFRFIRAGLGFHTSFSRMVDGIAELTYESLEIEEHHHELDENGFGIAAGIRVLFNEHLEGTARARYVDLGDEEDEIFSAELLYLFNHSFGLVAAYEKGNEEIISAGVRFQF